ncbi:BEN domain-containing protein 6 isoform X2 [Apodemus sylvaticus]|uniref:BEN domain-containing protein 6 isoform X2 n=1 Tax=Apodemus sylvaticus TaxID=10129 RepID=UPI002244F49D|nr:BEN domain-containing protein 6 isoform X2 [Apodemus sylvaticus]
MQKILQTDDITDNQVLRKRKRKRTETVNSENTNSAQDKAQRDPYSGNAFLPGESSSDEETPLAELSKEELCNKIENLKEKLRSIRKENSRLRQSLVMLQVPAEARRGNQILQTRATGSCEPPRMCLESNPGPPEEQPVLLTTVPSLRHIPHLFSERPLPLPQILMTASCVTAGSHPV